MPHDLDLIFTLTGGLAVALALGLVTQRLKMSPIVGYLLAGVVVGPFTPGFVADKPIADQLAEIGVILLMFGVGLHFHLRELLAVRKVAIPGALLQIAAATALGALAGRAAGWSWGAAVIFGLALSVASTVVLTRVLADNNALHTPAGHLAVGWLVLEDLFTVLALVLLPVFAGGGGSAGLLRSMGLTALKLAALLGLMLLVGRWAIPRVLGYVARTGSRELFTLAVLVSALGIAVGAAQLFGVSMALGAFLAGMVVGQSDFGARAAAEALPLRDAFSVLFFVSIGMLLDPAQLVASWRVAALALAVVLVAKPLAAIAVVLLLGRPAATAVTVGLALAQIGEFSFLLAAVGRQLGLLGQEASQALVVTAITSIVLNPPLFARRELFARWLARLAPGRGARAEAAGGDRGGAGPAHRAVVVGYGPVGRTLTRLLRESGIAPTVIEMNLDTVKALKAAGTPAVYGDASQREILERAGVADAGSLFFTAGGAPAEAVIQQARAVNPRLFVLARAAYLREGAALRRAGAEPVAAEGEVALAMAERLLARLGATPEQRERERARVYDELSGDSA
jgi:monovalent cation:H+ antiporter-2, CPA2 family